MAIWNAAFEATPGTSDDASYGDDKIRELKSETRIRLGHEHTNYVNKVTGTPGDPSQDGWHLPGSGVCFYGTSYPVYRPDGITAINADDVGRLWYDTTTRQLKVYDGNAVNSAAHWVALPIGIVPTSQPSTLEDGMLWVV